MAGDVTGSPIGLHRVLSPSGVLPQQAEVLDADPSPWPDEVVVAVRRLNLDAASFRQLREAHGSGLPCAGRCWRSSPRGARCRIR